MSLTKVTYSMIADTEVNIWDYGADPTGVADSTSAIQAAIDSGAKTIRVPAGTYKTTNELRIYQRFGITMAGEYGSIIRYAGTYVPNRAVLKLEVASYCNIERIQFDSWAGGADLISEINHS